MLRILLTAGEVPLNNGGDEIQLRDATGATVSLRSYVAGQAVSGQILSF